MKINIKKTVLLVILATLLTATSYMILKRFIIKELTIFQYFVAEIVFVVSQMIVTFAKGKIN